MSCLECGAPLGKRQKKFCCCRCMNTFNGRAMVEKRKVSNPDRFRVCSECGENKAIRMFSLINKTNASEGHREVCKRCSAALRYRQRTERLWQEDAVGIMLMNSKQRAKSKGLENTLTREDIVIPEFCPVLGIRLHVEDRAAKYAAPSIDRIDNSKGYTPDNIVVVSVRANILKRDATLTELRALVKFYDTLVDEHPGLL
jgi:hypothetical protein